jgi:hypothetical protein
MEHSVIGTKVNQMPYEYKIPLGRLFWKKKKRNETPSFVRQL